jgi:hypothetical protein
MLSVRHLRGGVFVLGIDIRAHGGVVAVTKPKIIVDARVSVLGDCARSLFGARRANHLNVMI